LTGSIDALLPQVDAGTRTQHARIVLDNPDGTLVPGMFVQVALQPEAALDVVLVPTGAVIADGNQTRVIVQGDAGRFSPMIVRTGTSAGGMTEILSGLSGGEKVVASGQFLIDSEANLSGALERLGAKDDAP
jgi:membrane fusion protein, copper/silver efflux system